jgi:hypothetical protein
MYIFHKNQHNPDKDDSQDHQNTSTTRTTVKGRAMMSVFGCVELHLPETGRTTGRGNP